MDIVDAIQDMDDVEKDKNVAKTPQNCEATENTSSQIALSKEEGTSEILSLSLLKQEVDEDIGLVIYEALTTAIDVLKQHIAPALEEQNQSDSEKKLRNGLGFRDETDLLFASRSDSHQESSVTPCISPIMHKALQSMKYFPSIFDSLLRDVVNNGVSRVPWCILRIILLLKAEKVFASILPPKVFSMKTIMDSLRPLRVCVSHLWKLSLAPFTIQRAAEFLFFYKAPPSQRAIIKFSYALSRTINLVTIWLPHCIPSSVVEFQKALESDQVCYSLLQAINPGVSSLSFSTIENCTPAHNGGSAFFRNSDEESVNGNTRHMNDEDEDIVTPDVHFGNSQNSDPTRQLHRRSRNSFEVFTPRRGYSPGSTCTELEQLPDESYRPPSPNEHGSSPSTISTLLRRDHAERPAQDQGNLSPVTQKSVNIATNTSNQAVSREAYGNPPPCGVLDVARDLIPLIASKPNGCENDDVEPDAVESTGTRQSRDASHSFDEDDEIRRPQKRMKTQFSNNVSCGLPNYLDKKTETNNAAPSCLNTASAGVDSCGTLDISDAQHPFAAVLALPVPGYPPHDASNCLHKESNGFRSTTTDSTLNSESLCFLEQLRTSGSPCVSSSILPKDYFDTTDADDLSSDTLHLSRSTPSIPDCIDSKKSFL